MKTRCNLVILLSALLTLAASLTSCKQTPAIEEPDIAFATYVKSYTGGILNHHSSIRIELMSPACNSASGSETDLFSFNPPVRGQAHWTSPETIEFIPEQDAFRPGCSYDCTFKLGKITKPHQKGLENFRFRFMIADKQARLAYDRLVISGPEDRQTRIEGRIRLSEAAGEEKVRSMLECSEPHAGIDIQKGGSELLYKFTINGLERKKEDRTVHISLNPGKTGFKTSSGISVVIPGKDVFRILDSRNVSTDNPYIETSFSEVLADLPDADGLIELEGAGQMTYKIEDNFIRVYYSKNTASDLILHLHGGLKAADGRRLGEEFQKYFAPGEEKPAVHIGKGTILPDAAQTILPFQAVNLAAVDLSIIQIYEDNILMFLQDNNLDESSALRRSGRLVYKNTIRLDNDPSLDLHKLQNFSIDLSDLFKKEPGALYRIRLSFKKDYSLYGKETADLGEEKMTEIGAASLSDEEKSIWDIPYAYYYDDDHLDWSQYNWEDTENPDKPTYYMQSSRFPYCNLMSSNIGLIAKYAGDDQIWLSSSDILTGKPMPGVGFEIYNFQLRKIGQGKADSNGLAEITLSGKPFAVVASSGEAKAYLKVTESTQEMLSRFDVGGRKVRNGLNAYIYGERGVWRPGDTLHVTMILNGKSGIPDSHPASLELYTPSGQFYSKQICPSGTNGFYTYSLPTRPDDPTGIWQAHIKVGGAEFQKALQIENIRPNRIRIQMDLGKEILEGGSSEVLDMEANWLTGPAASGLPAKAEMTLTPAGSWFKGYEGYDFRNPLSQFTSSEHEILNTRLNEEGKTKVQIRMPEARTAPGLLNANILCSVMEKGGESSYTSRQYLYSPFSSYVGIKVPETDASGYLETDRDYQIQVVAVDCQGRKMSGQQLEWRIYKMKWSWWWESRAEELDSYVNGTGNEVIASGRLISGKKAVTIPFRINYPEWGRYLVYVKDLSSGHACGKVIFADWPAYKGRSSKSDPDNLTMLSFSTSKKSYRPGEKAEVFIPGPANGMALVSIENGSRVISREWIPTTAGTDTRYEFTVTEEMAPNFYIHTSLVQPHSHPDNDLPIRLYGVIPVMVENEASHLHPVISMKDQVAPEEEFEIRISERDNRPMSYTLAIVDDGLLDLTSFKTPDAWSHMYSREALGVSTWDLYDQVIGAYTGKFSPIFSVGGDQEIRQLEKGDRRFNPIVLFQGPFTLQSGTKVHRFKLPMYVGSVRVMLVAAQDNAFGNAEKEVSVKSPLMILPSLPRTISAGEKVSLPVNVFALEKGLSKVNVKVHVEGPARLAGPGQESLTFNEPGDQIVRFQLEAEQEGLVKIRIEAEAGDKTCSTSLSLNVRNAHPKITHTRKAMIEAGDAIEFTWDPFNRSEDDYASLSLSSFPAVDLNALFEDLHSYPASCTEQLAAKGMVLLYGKDLLSESVRSAGEKMIPEIIQELYGLQLADGGFAFWGGESSADEWTSSMAGQFLDEASRQGYEVSGEVLARWKAYQNQTLRNYRASGHPERNDLVQAYRLYTLALASSPDNGAMNRMKEEDRLSLSARWMLAATYAICGKKAVAEELLDHTETQTSYGNDNRDKAIALQALIRMDELEPAVRLARNLAEDLSGSWHTSQESAFIAMAMKELAKHISQDGIKAEITIAGQKEKAESDQSLLNCPVDPTAGNIRISNLTEGQLCAVLVTSSHSEEAVQAASSGLRLSVSYLDQEGNELHPDHLRQGTDLTAIITVTNTSLSEDRHDLLLLHTLPSGWELVNERLLGATDIVPAQNAFHYHDMKDDRNLWSFDLDRGMSKTFKTRINAAYEGEFILPSITCEALNEPEINARTASGKTNVTRKQD